MRVPDGVDDTVAAARMLRHDAHYLVHGGARRGPATRLVHAARAGRGLLLVQMLKAAGAMVIGT